MMNPPVFHSSVSQEFRAQSRRAKAGRAEITGFENRRTRKGTVGSNPSSSAVALRGDVET